MSPPPRSPGRSSPDCASGDYVESLLADYQRSPTLVSEPWRRYFRELLAEGPSRAAAVGAPSFKRASLFNPPSTNGAAPRPRDAGALQERVAQLVRAFRSRGHLMADLDPLGRPREEPAELSLKSHGLSRSDLDTTISTTLVGGPERQTLRELVARLKNTYCRSIGVQFMHIDELPLRNWLSRRMEESENRIHLERDEQVRILSSLTDAVIFEQFLRKKFVGAKTFSLEGGESLIPLLHLAIEKAARQGVVEVVIGMAHRGRLNVLANIMRKNPKHIFQEFEDADPELHPGGGDVKYHLGYSSDWTTADDRHVHLSLCFNPSHLEFVDPVVLGRTRAKQDRFQDDARRKGMALLVHGDAAFIGEGVVQETLNLSGLEGYHVGGTLHVILNNQLGFTTPPEEGRSAQYATDVARMLQIPIFHVNGEDPEAVAQVVGLALDFRGEFQRDVVIDIYCYRRRGHNESDEPSFTQPVMYEAIENRPSVRDDYLARLLELGEIEEEDADRIADWRRQRLDEAFDLAKEKGEAYRVESLGSHWKGYRGGNEPADDIPDTQVDRGRLAELLLKLNETPDGFQIHRKLGRFRELREEMAAGEKPLDWSAGEALAFASLATEGVRIRMSGQDSRRGTFSQRHAVIFDMETGESHLPLAHLEPDQAPVEIINSPLSENGVLGFEYGYSLDRPDALVLWEAQFGDFVNAGQVIIDQFITSAEDKWRRLSGIVLLLPHGFEGMGPEHSSARLERFLMLSAEQNIQVAQPTTAAQYFHLLRRQALRRWRKPLVVMTPKSLLRHPQVTSPLEDLAGGQFHRVLADERKKPPETGKILLCTGKVYFDLTAWRAEEERDDVAIVRMEQLYPLPEAQLRGALKNYGAGTPLVWVQEEPLNMGAWWFMRMRLGERVLGSFPMTVAARAESASPATGSKASHEMEQNRLLRQAFA